MATLKELLQNFCYRINQPAPTSFVGVSSPAERQYVSLFQCVGDRLRNMPYLWPQLKRGYTFTTQTNVANYQLPGDFYRLLMDDAWDRTNQWPMRGPISDRVMQARQFAVIGLQTRKVYQLIGPTQYLFATSPFSQRSASSITIDPPGSNNTDSLFLGYMSCNWVWPADWVAGAVYAAGSLVTGNGNIYFTTAGGTAGTTRPSVTTGSEIDGPGGVTWLVYHEPYLVNPANTKLTDNAICLFDEDLMIEGMRWEYKRAKGQPFEDLRAEWERMAASACSRFTAPSITSLAGSGYSDLFNEFPLMPPGNWSI